MGSRVAKVVQLVAVSVLGDLDAANAAPGTLALETTTGDLYIVNLLGAVRSAVLLGTAPQSSTRTLGVVVTPGAGASGKVEYAVTVLNGAGAPVQGALIFVGLARTAGAGAVGLVTVTVGSLISAIDDAAKSQVAMVLATDATGVCTYTIGGTAGDTVQVTNAIDAPNAGSSNLDAGRVLP